MPSVPKVKKLVPVLTISGLVNKTGKEAQEIILDRVSCIHYLVQFQKDKRATIQALIDLDSKINAMTPVYAKQLGLQVQKLTLGPKKSTAYHFGFLEWSLPATK